MPLKPAPRSVLLVPCAVLAAVAGWNARAISPVPVPAPPATTAVTLAARVVHTLQGAVVARRRGRVRGALRAPGTAVAAGDPLIEFDDLALFESRADLERELEQERAKLEEASDPGGTAARSQAVRLRRAALRQIEESYAVAREEFDRWLALSEEGLVSRIQFQSKEAEFAAISRRLEESKAAAAESDRSADSPLPDRGSPRLRRLEPLLDRLKKLPDTYFVRSPWNGAVQAIHVAAGDVAERGATLATVARAAVGRLEAEADPDLEIVEVRSACGIPGPFPFALREGVLSLISPSPTMSLGQICDLTVLVRARPRDRRN